MFFFSKILSAFLHITPTDLDLRKSEMKTGNSQIPYCIFRTVCSSKKNTKKKSCAMFSTGSPFQPKFISAEFWPKKHFFYFNSRPLTILFCPKYLTHNHEHSKRNFFVNT